MHRILIVFGFVCAFLACKKGFLGNTKDNIAPETHTVADTIIRSGDNRFISQIKITWWGDDKDGFVKGFEFSFDGISWAFTTVQDSFFTLALPSGSDTADFKFMVRAVDNNGLKDPTPAILVYPVKNSAPICNVFIPVGSAQFPSKNTLRTFPAFKFYWTGNDPDGADNLDHFELFLNDTLATPYIVPPTITEAAFVAKDLLTNTPDCEVYSGTNQKLTALMKGLKLNSTNIFYVRAVDKVGTASLHSSSYSFYCKKPINKILVMNATSPFSAAKLSLFQSNMQSVGLGTFDTLNAFIKSSNNLDELSPDYFTQNKVLKFFDKIVWFSENDSVALGFAQRSLGEFLANSGRVFMAVNLSQFLYEQSALFDFTPIKELIPDTQGVFRMNTNALLHPLISGYPTLKSTSIISSARPFLKAIDNSSSKFVDVYTGELIVSTQTGPVTWSGPSVVCAKRMDANTNQTNFIFTSMPLDRLNGNANMDSLFRKALVQELGF
jgi:hypothetical protein